MLTGRIMGAKSLRPTKAPKSAKIPFNKGPRRYAIGIAVTPELHERISHVCAMQRMSRSRWVCELVERELARWPMKL